jgi:hypothetical protein
MLPDLLQVQDRDNRQGVKPADIPVSGWFDPPKSL